MFSSPFLQTFIQELWCSCLSTVSVKLLRYPFAFCHHTFLSNRQVLELQRLVNKTEWSKSLLPTIEKSTSVYYIMPFTKLNSPYYMIWYYIIFRFYYNFSCDTMNIYTEAVWLLLIHLKCILQYYNFNYNLKSFLSPLASSVGAQTWRAEGVGLSASCELNNRGQQWNAIPIGDNYI